MSVFITIIAGIFVFSLLIFTHELGHFLAAKSCGILVSDFSLGMGPTIWKKQGKETSYHLRLLPIGGACIMEGEDESSDSSRGFCNKSVPQRMLVVFSGPLMNFITAFVLFVILYAGLGYYVTTNVIGAVAEDSPAMEAGLLQDDRVVEINGEPISDWYGISNEINKAAGSAVNLQIVRDGQEMSMIIQPQWSESNGQEAWRIGITQSSVRDNIFVAIGKGCRDSIMFIKQLVLGIVGMFRGTEKVEVAGPVGIVTIIGDFAAVGLRALIQLTAILSINLGLVNLFPLPALDGSRLVFLAVEGIRGKAISREKEGMVHFVGLMLLFGLMILVTYQDIMRLINGS